MPALLVPILAQAVALQLGDRTELRVVRDEIRRDLEAETRPRARLALTWPRASLAIGYAPSLRVAPIDSPSARERSVGLVPDERFTVLHAADGIAAVSFGAGRTTLNLSQTASWALRNFSQEALSGGAPSSNQVAPPATSTPGLPSTTQVGRTISRDLNWGSARFGIALGHALSRNHTFGVGLAYDASGGLGTTARRFYPLIHGPDASLSLLSILSRRTQLSSVLSANYNFSEVAQPAPLLEPRPFLVTRSWAVVQTETISHQISRNLSAELGGGVGYSRNDEAGRPEVGEFAPTGSVALTHQASVAQGTLSTRLTSALTPNLNSSTGTIEWWYTSAVNIGWQGDRWALSLGSEGGVSLNSQSADRYRGLRGWASVSYDLRHGFTAELGTRAIWEQVNGRYTILPSVVGFAALSWGTTQRID